MAILFGIILILFGILCALIGCFVINKQDDRIGIGKFLRVMSFVIFIISIGIGIWILAF